MPVKISPATGERRKVIATWVEFTEDGRVFTLKLQRNQKGDPVHRRVYGDIYQCKECGIDYFRSTHQKGQFCTNRCSKMGNRNPTRRRTQKNMGMSCDKTFSLIVRSAGRCTHCSSTDDLQCAHGFSRQYRAVRWDLRNAFCLCRKCHLYYTHRYIEWDNWLRARWGEELYWELRDIALSGVKVDLAERLETLREQAERLAA